MTRNGATRRWSALPLLASAMLSACTEPPGGGGDLEGLDGTAAMEARLRELANGLDGRLNPFQSEARLRQLRANGPQAGYQAQLVYRGQLSELLVHTGSFEEAVAEIRSLLADIRAGGQQVPDDFHRIIAELEVKALLKWDEQRTCVDRGEVARCTIPVTDVGPRRGAAPAREAVAALERIVAHDPSRLDNRWLLNLGYMLLGEYPEGVPPQWLIPVSAFASDHDLGRFEDVASAVGVGEVGHAGGAVLDDFDRDGDLDLMTSGWLLEDRMRYYENDGAGAFVDRSELAGVAGLRGGLNLKQADFDNDGSLDVLVLRGAWMPYGQPNSLLRNRGDGTFEDVTDAAGLLDARSTQAADWGDYDNDGLVDLFIGNESSPSRGDASQLFRNNGDGTFTDLASAAGVAVVGPVKGVAWGDYDNDGDLDLYVGRNGEPNSLFRNDPGPSGSRRFTDVADGLAVRYPIDSFALWFWDYDNDGWLDIYVGGYRTTLGDVGAEYLGRRTGSEMPRLYRNAGDGSFEDVTESSDLDRIQYLMGSNYGDLDNDGYLDFYVGTGDPDVDMMIPNRMFRNDRGRTFQDVTTSGGFGLTLKGHAVSFGDADNDGDQDVFINMGGATQSDRARSVFFENPGHGARWVTLRLVGTRTNRAAIGARVAVTIRENGGERTVRAHVSSGSSFGANSLQLEMGLGAAEAITEILVEWPTSGTTQRFTEVQLDRVYRVVEGEGALEVVDAPSFEFGVSGVG